MRSRPKLLAMPWTILLAASSIAVAAFIAAHHSFVPMWIEGMPEYEHQIMAALGYAPWTGGCGGVTVGGHFLPLGVNSYTGAANTWLDLPASYLWLSGISNDPYSYRYTTIFVLLASAWLFYAILERVYGSAAAFYGALILMISPIELLVALTDHRVLLTLELFATGMFFLGILYLRTRNRAYLWACCFVAGLSLWDRPEIFVLSLLCVALFALFFRRREVFSWWRSTARRLALVAGGVAFFVAGAVPVIAYNLQCPSRSYASLFRGRFASSAAADVFPNLLLRIRQFFTFDLLNQLPLYRMSSRDVALAMAFGIAAVVILRDWIRNRRPDFPFFAVLMLPFFIFSATGLREIHLLTLELAVIAVVVSGCSRLARERPWVMHAVLISVAAGTAWATASDWHAWNALPPAESTKLNQSDPPLLVSSIRKNYPEAQLFFTNIGLPEYVEYVSKGELKGQDILNWFSTDDFDRDVRMALLATGAQRVFIAIPSERDSLESALPRTRRLESLLHSLAVPYRKVRLSNPRNTNLYDLFVVEKGAGPLSGLTIQPSIVIESIGWNNPRDGVVTGTIYGRGFDRGDAVIVDGQMVFPTAFGSDRFITTAIPVSEITGRKSSRIEVLRPSKMERSPAFVTLWSVLGK